MLRVMALRQTRRLLSDASHNHRPLRQAARAERVLLEALSTGQSTHWHGPRVHVHSVEMTPNLQVTRVLCEPFDDLSRVPGAEEKLKRTLEKRRGALTRLVNCHLDQKKATRLDFLWVSEAPAASKAEAQKPGTLRGTHGQRLASAFAQLQAEADEDAAREAYEARMQPAGAGERSSPGDDPR
jgi:hypothetical protein